MTVRGICITMRAGVGAVCIHTGQAHVYCAKTAEDLVDHDLASVERHELWSLYCFLSPLPLLQSWWLVFTTFFAGDADIAINGRPCSVHNGRTRLHLPKVREVPQIIRREESSHSFLADNKQNFAEHAPRHTGACMHMCMRICGPELSRRKDFGRRRTLVGRMCDRDLTVHTCASNVECVVKMCSRVRAGCSHRTSKESAHSRGHPLRSK